MVKKCSLKPFLVFFLLACLAVATIGCGGNGVYFQGHKGTKVFHRPGCKYAPPKNVSVTFVGSSKAIKAGYSPCSVCDPTGKAEKDGGSGH